MIHVTIGKSGTVHGMLNEAAGKPICGQRGQYKLVHGPVNCANCIKRGLPEPVLPPTVDLNLNLTVLEEGDSNLPALLHIRNFNKPALGNIHTIEINSETELEFYLNYVNGANGTGGYWFRLVRKSDGKSLRSRYTAKKYAMAIMP